MHWVMSTFCFILHCVSFGVGLRSKFLMLHFKMKCVPSIKLIDPLQPLSRSLDIELSARWPKHDREPGFFRLIPAIRHQDVSTFVPIVLAGYRYENRPFKIVRRVNVRMEGYRWGTLARTHTPPPASSQGKSMLIVGTERANREWGTSYSWLKKIVVFSDRSAIIPSVQAVIYLVACSRFINFAKGHGRT